MKEEIEKNYYNKLSYSQLMIICALLACLFIRLFFFYDYSNQFRLSVKSGFYEDSFDLKILGAGEYDVYYTLDCSTPTLSSFKYEGPIQISDRTSEPNEFAQRDDVSTGFLTNRIELFSLDCEDPEYVPPQYNVDKCTVLRAVRFDKDGNKIDEISGVYFVGPDIKKKYQDIMVASIATDPDNLFDYYDGIYVNGIDFDDYWENFDTTLYNPQWWETIWYMWPANYRRTGRESEREARIEIFDTEQNSLMSQNCGLKVQGAGSRGKLPRNLKIISREEYSGNRIFQEDLLENGLDTHKYIIFGGADDNVYKLNDYLAQSMESDLNFATMDFKPCVLFLEGEYWGTYYLTECYDDDYIESHYNVPRDEVVIWKEGEIDEGNEDDMALYTDMVSFITENDMSVEENYEKACEMIDINSFADYYAAQIFIARCGDWPRGNIAAWRSRNINLNSKYQDGKWRWMLFDLNSEISCLDLELLENDTIGKLIEINDPLFTSLTRNDSFKQLICERLLYVSNSLYSEDKVNDFIDSYYEEMLETLCLSNKRFYGEERREELIENAENVRTFLLERHKYIDESIKKNFGEEYLKYDEGALDK